MKNEKQNEELNKKRLKEQFNDLLDAQRYILQGYLTRLRRKDGVDRAIERLEVTEDFRNRFNELRLK